MFIIQELTQHDFIHSTIKYCQQPQYKTKLQLGFHFEFLC